MAVRYIQGHDDQLPRHPATTFDDDAAQGWWSGVFFQGVQIALAAAITVTAQSAAARTQWAYDEQVPAGNLHQPINEDYWQNAVPPVPLVLGKLYLPDPDEIPAANLHGQPDEDFFWQQLLPQPVPFVLGKLYLPDPDEIPAGNLHGQFDEDFWINPVQPFPLSFLALQQWGFDDETPTLSSVFIPNEDYWQGLATMSVMVNTGFPAWFPAAGDAIVPTPAGASQDGRISYDKYGTGNYMTGDIPIGRDQ